MKKIINRLFCALILLCAVGFLGGCKQEPETNSSPSIVGTWVCNEEVAPNKLVFLDSGFVTFYLYGTVLATGTYSVTGNSAKYIHLVMMRMEMGWTVFLRLNSVIQLLHFQLIMVMVQIVLLM